jgi:3-deoxy-manno-octulosonate cytidylyltransferase (CMP-KDO synthetase)
MWTYNRALKSGVFDEVYVATDDRQILHAVEKHGGSACMTMNRHVSGTDRVFELAQRIECEFVVNLQGDEPWLPIHVIKSFAAKVLDLDNLTLLTCVSNATIEDMNNPNVVKAVLDAHNYALYFSRASIPFFRNDIVGGRYKHSGIYGFSKKGLEMFCNFPPGRLEKIEKLEQLRALEYGMKILCLKKNYDSINIDTPEDLNKFRLFVDKIKN